MLFTLVVVSVTIIVDIQVLNKSIVGYYKQLYQ